MTTWFLTLDVCFDRQIDVQPSQTKCDLALRGIWNEIAFTVDDDQSDR